MLSTVEYANGDIEHYKDGLLHQDNDQPACIMAPSKRNPRGCREWYQDGKLHRIDDMPASADIRSHRWYLNGELHRDGDQPAIMLADGSQYWYQRNMLHRSGGKPAAIDHDSDSGELLGKAWYINDRLHRGSGKPAIKRYYYGKVIYRAWYYHGDLTKEETSIIQRSKYLDI